MAEAMDCAEVDIQLPDSLWLTILGYLENPVEVARLASVCRRWYQLTHDASLWRRVNFTERRRLTLTKLKVFVRRPLAAHLQCLRIEGALYSSRVLAGDKNTISKSLLSELSSRCPHLRELHVLNADLAAKANVALSDMPPSLVHLSLAGTVLPFDLLASLPEALPRLTGLDLSGAHNLSSLSKSVPGILAKTQLEILLLRRAFKLTKAHLLDLPVALPRLRVLNVAETDAVDDDLLTALANHSANLQSLDVSFCLKVSSGGVADLCGERSLCQKGLRRLLLTETLVGGEAVATALGSLTSLRRLSLVKTRMKKKEVERVRGLLPSCRVESRFAEMNEQPGAPMWFVPVDDEPPSTSVHQPQPQPGPP